MAFATVSVSRLWAPRPTGKIAGALPALSLAGETPLSAIAGTQQRPVNRDGFLPDWSAETLVKRALG